MYGLCVFGLQQKLDNDDHVMIHDEMRRGGGGG